MTDKEKIREAVEKRYEYWREKEFNSHSIESEIRMSECQHLLLMLNSLQEGPMSEDLEEASKDWLRPQLDKSYANYGEAKMMELTHFDGYSMLEAIEFGAKWKEEQFEKNRLKHCNSITNEQAELEQGFVDQHLDKYDRMPTFLDAIEYGMAKEEENIKKSPYLCGYVARDKNGLLHVFEFEPRRLEDYWWDLDFQSAPIAHDAFPDLKWEDEPIYVRLLIVEE